MKSKNNILKKLANKAYEFGFVSKIKTEVIERGLNEDVIRLISGKKNEPEWMLEFRLQAYRYWLTLEMPSWAHLSIPPIDYQAISYYADPLKKNNEGKSKEIDPELMKTFEKLGIPLEERLALSGTAVDAVMDSVSVKTTFKEELKEKGIIFCSMGSPCEPVETIKSSPSNRFFVFSTSINTPSGIFNSPIFTAASTTLNMLRPDSATLRRYFTARSMICCNLCTLEANVAIIKRRLTFSENK